MTIPDLPGTPPMMPPNNGTTTDAPREKLVSKLLKGLALAAVSGAVAGPTGVKVTSAITEMVNKSRQMKQKQDRENAIASAKAEKERKTQALEERKVAATEKKNADWKASSDKTHAQQAYNRFSNDVAGMATFARDTILGKPGVQKSPEELEKFKSQTAANKALEYQRKNKPASQAKATGAKTLKETAKTSYLDDGTLVSFDGYENMTPQARTMVKDHFAKPEVAQYWDMVIEGKKKNSKIRQPLARTKSEPSAVTNAKIAVEEVKTKPGLSDQDKAKQLELAENKLNAVKKVYGYEDKKKSAFDALTERLDKLDREAD